MTEQEWHNLYENFETTCILDAVGHIDTLRSHLSDRDSIRPPQMRDDMLQLHQLAMDVVNNGWDGQLRRMAFLTVSLEDQAMAVMLAIETIHKTLSQLLALLPESAFEFETTICKAAMTRFLTLSESSIR